MKKLYTFLLLLLCFSLPQLQAGDTLRIRVGSIDLCPGEVKDIPVYIDGVKPDRPLSSIYFHLYISDSTLFELVTTYWDPIRHMGNPVMTEVDVNLARLGPAAYNYMTYIDKRDTSYLPRFLYSWYDGSTREPSYIPTSDRPIFKLRVRCKKRGKGYLTLRPKSSEIYSGIGAEGPKVHKFTVLGDTGWISNSNDPVVYAGEDKNFCVNTQQLITGATGGVSYRWKGISWDALAYEYALDGKDRQHPTFKASFPGWYTYAVEIADSRGCYSIDTINFNVSENNLFLRMGKMGEMPKDTIIDLGGRLNLSVEPYNVYYDDNDNYYEGTASPYAIEWTPDSMVLHASLAHTLSKPIYEPVHFRVKVSDTNGCLTTMTKGYTIRGSEFSGVMGPFPIYHCGENNFTPQTADLNIVMKGGSGNFTYEWSGVQLEGGSESFPPSFADRNAHTTKVTYTGKTAFMVRVYDVDYDREFYAFDTISLLSRVSMEPLLSLENKGTLCEGDTLIFKANFTNGGNAPFINWFVNDRVIAAGVDTIFRAVNLNVGDKVNYTVYSNQACVFPSTASSEYMESHILPWTYPSVRIEDTAYTSCGDSARFIAVVENGGREFDLTFILNDEHVLNKHTYKVENPAYAKVAFVYNPSNYYDFVSCMVTNGTAQCMRFDTTNSGAMYPLVKPMEGVEVSEIWASTKDTICEMQEVKMRLLGVRNLGEAEDILIRWMCKSEGEDVAQEVARYAYPSGEAEVRRDLKEGFPVIFNTESGPKLRDGDRIYCVLSSRNPCLGADTENPDKGLLTMDSTTALAYRVFATALGQLSIDMPYETRAYVCERDTVIFRANAENVGGNCVYRWYRNNEFLPQANGDTLVLPTFLRGDTVSCEVSTDFACVSGYPLRVNAPEIEVKIVEIELNRDTAVCYGRDVLLSADGGNEYTWSPTVGLDDPNTATPLASVNENTTYSVKVKDAFACENTDSVHIRIIPLDAEPMVHIEADRIFLCNAEEVTFRAKVAYSDSIAWFVNGVFIEGSSDFQDVRERQAIGGEDERVGLTSSDLSAEFSYVPNHKDTVYALVYSSFDCTIEEVLISNKIGVERYNIPQDIYLKEDTLVCENSDFWLRAENPRGYNYRWYLLTDSERIKLSDSSSVNIHPTLGTQMYYAQIYDDSEDCFVYDSVFVTALANELPISLMLEADRSLLCEDGAVVFTASVANADSIVWMVNDSVYSKEACADNVEHVLRYMPKHADSVFAIAFSSAYCAMNNPAFTPKIGIEKYAYPPLTNVNEDTLFCYGEEMSLRASGALHYRWTDSAGLALVLGEEDMCCPRFMPSVGLHKIVLQAYDNEACSLYDTVLVNVLAYEDSTLARLSVDKLTSCEGDSVRLLAEGENGYNITWYINGVNKRTTDFHAMHGEDVLMYAPMDNDSVVVRVASAHLCALNSPAYSKTIHLRNYAYPVLHKSADTVLCTGDIAELYFSGAPNYRNFSASSLVWEQRGDTFAFVAKSHLSENKVYVYSVEAYVSPYCVSADSIRVTYVHPDVKDLHLKMESDSLCLGSDFTFRAKGKADLYYTWYVNGIEKGFTVEDEEKGRGSHWLYTPEQGDSVFVLQVLGDSERCGNRQSVRSNVVYPSPVALSVELSPDRNICLGDTVEIFAITNARSFVWSPKADMLTPKETVSLVHPSSTTPYVFRAKSAFCTLTDTTFVFVHALPETPLVKDGLICPEAGGEAKGSLSVTNADSLYTYVWYSDTLADAVHTGDMYEVNLGVYFVSARSLQACASKDFGSGKVSLDKPVIADFEASEMSALAGTELQFTNYSENADTWMWYFGDGEVSTEMQPTHVYDTARLYSVWLRASNKNNCFDTTSSTLEILPKVGNGKDPLVFIPSAFAPGATNAEDRVFKVYGPSIKSLSVRVSNTQGTLVFQTNKTDVAWDGLYQGKECPAGTYFYEVVVDTREGERVQKVGNVTLIR